LSGVDLFYILDREIVRDSIAIPSGIRSGLFYQLISIVVKKLAYILLLSFTDLKSMK